MVDFVPRQGRTKVYAAGVAALRRGQKPAENAVSGQKMPFPDGLWLLSQNVKNQGKYNTYDDAGSNWKVEFKILLLYKNVSGKLPKPGNLRYENQKNANASNDHSCYDKKFSNVG